MDMCQWPSGLGCRWNGRGKGLGTSGTSGWLPRRCKGMEREARDAASPPLSPSVGGETFSGGVVVNQERTMPTLEGQRSQSVCDSRGCVNRCEWQCSALGANAVHALIAGNGDALLLSAQATFNHKTAIRCNEDAWRLPYLIYAHPIQRLDTSTTQHSVQHPGYKFPFRIPLESCRKASGQSNVLAIHQIDRSSHTCTVRR